MCATCHDEVDSCSCPPCLGRVDYVVTRRGIYDNMKTAVDRVKKGKGRTVNKRFAVML